MAALKRRSLVRSESGAVLVEFALLLPFLLIVIGGIVDFARLFQAYEVVTNAAREGARMASMPGYDLNTYQMPRQRVADYLVAGGVTGAHVATCTLVSISLGGGGTGSGVSCNVSYTHDFMFVGPIFGLINRTFTNTLTFNTTSTVRTEMQVVVPPPGG